MSTQIYELLKDYHLQDIEQELTARGIAFNPNDTWTTKTDLLKAPLLEEWKEANPRKNPKKDYETTLFKPMSDAPFAPVDGKWSVVKMWAILWVGESYIFI